MLHLNYRLYRLDKFNAPRKAVGVHQRSSVGRGNCPDGQLCLVGGSGGRGCGVVWGLRDIANVMVKNGAERRGGQHVMNDPTKVEPGRHISLGRAKSNGLSVKGARHQLKILCTLTAWGGCGRGIRGVSKTHVVRADREKGLVQRRAVRRKAKS